MSCFERSNGPIGTEIDIEDIKGTMFDFEKAGDVLPKHVHDETNAHITIVARGRIKAYSHDWEKEIVAGQIANFCAEEPHEFMALEDNTRIFNIIKRHGGEGSKVTVKKGADQITARG